MHMTQNAARAAKLKALKDKQRAMELSALRSGEPTPDVCECPTCTKLRKDIAELEG